MQTFTIKLKDYFNFITDENVTLTAYISHASAEMKQENIKRPTILLCPGGGYRNISEREGEPVALNLLTKGLNCFVLRYSIAPDFCYPTQLIEVAAAFKLIEKNADEWHVDTERLGIMGFSAGGHLSAHYSNAYRNENILAHIENPKRPDFCVLCYPVITAVDRCHNGSFVNLSGHELTDAERESFSAERLVTADTPPTFIWSTSTDKSVPIISSILYAESLSKYDVPFALHIYPYGPHALATADRVTIREGKDVAARPEAQFVKRWINDLDLWFTTFLFGDYFKN